MTIYTQSEVEGRSIEELCRGAKGTDVVSMENGKAYLDWCVSSPDDVPEGFKIHATVKEWLSYSLEYDMNLVNQAREAGEV